MFTYALCSLLICVSSLLSTKSTTGFHIYSVQGKKWVNDTKICLMKKVGRLYKGIYSRGAIKKVAFNWHADCYATSGSFCKMASDSVNWDAIFNVFKPQNNELWKNEDRAAWEQVGAERNVRHSIIEGSSCDNIYIDGGAEKANDYAHLPTVFTVICSWSIF